jgi:hypothetical protein
MVGLPFERAAETADEVGQRVLMLADGESREFDAGRLVADACVDRVEGIVDVRGDFFGVFGGALRVRIVRHCFLDERHELWDGLIAGERVGVVVGRAFAGLAVAAGALVGVDFGARGCGGVRVGSAVNAQSVNDNECGNEAMQGESQVVLRRMHGRCSDVKSAGEAG